MPQLHAARQPLRTRSLRSFVAAVTTPLIIAASTVPLTIAAVVGGAPPAQAHLVIEPADYQQVSLARGFAETGEPMSLAVLPDRSVLHTARNGTLRRTDADGSTSTVATIAVYTHDEEGLQGVAVDPNFATNRYIYLYYAPPLATPVDNPGTPGNEGDAPETGTNWTVWQGVNRLSRFTLTAGFSIAAGSERTVLDVPADRGQCCHVGGDIDFDAAGNLYLTTGDDTNPFASDGFSPIDERTNRNPAFDAQRSSANTNDLRGKILRIKPTAAGGYTVPAGNMFAAGTPKTRPEIYAMGFRNPFRMSVDKATGVVYLGDYGPDVGGPGPRGPGGQVEFTRVTGPGNFGWPYCTGTNTVAETYAEYDFGTGTVGPKYNCAGGPTNNSFRNTGQATLAPAQSSWIKYDGCSVPAFGCGSESPMGGPVYRYDAANPSTIKFPADLNGHAFIGEYGRQWIKAVDVAANGAPGEIADFPWTGTQVMDMAFGPDGALYVLDYGVNSETTGLYRIEYIGGAARAPIAVAAGTPTSGQAPLTVAFSSAGSNDPAGGALTYSWNFGDGATSTSANPSHTYTTNGSFAATLTVRNPNNLTATASVPITVGNTAPTVHLIMPTDGQLFSFGDSIPFTIRVTDPEDASIDCSRAKLHYKLGHDSHPHTISTTSGCSGTVTTPTDGEHDPAANLYGRFEAEYTDSGGLTTLTEHFGQPRNRQAEHYSGQQGTNLYDKAPAHGGRAVGSIDNGDWIAFDRYNLASATGFTARVASAGAGGTLTVRAGSPAGPALGSVTVPVTGGWETYTDVSGAITGGPAGLTRLYLVASGGSGSLFDIDDFTFRTAPTVRQQAEAYTSQSGTQNVDDPGAQNGIRVGFVDSGDWVAFAGVQVAGARRFAARVSSGAPAGGTISVRAGSATGPVLGTVTVPNTGGYHIWTDVWTTLSAGTGSLFLTFTGTGGGLFDVDSFALTGFGTDGGSGSVVGISGKCMDVSNSGTADGTKVQLWGCNGTGAQRWSRSGHTLQALGKCLDVAGGATANGTKVQLWTCNGSGAQNWVPQANGTVRNPQSNRCLEAPGGQTGDGTGLRIWDCTTGTNQRWVF
jgi:glucose/arabinose dehydrogenase/PKD repeat protein